MEAADKVVVRWESLVAQAGETIRETIKTLRPTEPDVDGLLLLAEWLSLAAEDLSDDEARGLGKVYVTADIAPEAIRLALQEALYDELWGILRAGGWLEFL